MSFFSLGGSTTFEIYCTSSAETTGGKVTIDVSLSGQHVKTETYDFCNLISCPAHTGKEKGRGNCGCPGNYVEREDRFWQSGMSLK